VTTLTKVFVDNDEGLRHNRAVKPTQPNPTTAELEILRVLWEHGPHSVREVQRVMNEVKPTGYTTVLKLLQIMTGKGLVTRDETQRPQIYSARYPREHTQRQMLHDLVQRAFGGSVKALVLQALAGRKSTLQELKEMETLLDKIERGTK
jgi:BlaI family penicillinase repressor